MKSRANKPAKPRVEEDELPITSSQAVHMFSRLLREAFEMYGTGDDMKKPSQVSRSRDSSKGSTKRSRSTNKPEKKPKAENKDGDSDDDKPAPSDKRDKKKKD